MELRLQIRMLKKTHTDGKGTYQNIRALKPERNLQYQILSSECLNCKIFQYTLDSVNNRTVTNGYYE